MVSVLSEAARNQIRSLHPKSPYAEEIIKTGDVGTIITKEIDRICSTATLGEITRISLLINRLKKVNESEKEKITDQLNGISKKIIERVEDKTGPLKLSKVCLELFSEL